MPCHFPEELCRHLAVASFWLLLPQIIADRLFVLILNVLFVTFAVNQSRTSLSERSVKYLISLLSAVVLCHELYKALGGAGFS